MARVYRIALAMLAIVSLVFVSAAASPVDPEQPTCVSEYLTADGTIDFNQLDQTGFEGGLDIYEFDVNCDEKTGAPVFRSKKDQVTGDTAKTRACKGVNGTILAVAFYDGKLIVAGEFTRADGRTVNHIAAWDGRRWRGLGHFGMNSTVRTLTVFDDKLIAGGDFTTAGGDIVNRVAAWDGQYWSRMDWGLHKDVWAIGVHKDHLVAGGGFQAVNGEIVNFIVAWSGKRWLVVDRERHEAVDPPPVFGRT